MSSRRIAIAQTRPVKAQYDENMRRIGAVFGQVAGWDRVPDVLVFPEASPSGYFLEGGVRDLAVSGPELLADLAAQHAAHESPPMDVVIGFYERHRNQFYNAAMYATLGGPDPRAHHVHRKLFLPTYGVFDEKRFVQPGHDVTVFDTGIGRVAMLVCEDAWHSLTATLAALDGAEFLFVPSASPARGVVPAKMVGVNDHEEILPASLERWELLARATAGEHGVFLALAQLVGFEGGKGFPGASMIVGPGGDLRARGPLFEEAIVMADCDVRDIARARSDAPLLADLRAQLPHLIEPLTRAPRPPIAIAAPSEVRVERPGVPSSHPVVAEREAGDPLSIDADLVARWLEAFIRDEVTVRRGFTKGIVGLSGGVDSSLTAFLAARALGPENVVGVRMPYKASSPESLEHAAMVADKLSIQLETVDITAAVDGFAGAVSPKPDATRLGNVMARVRMITLFDRSAAHHALPLGTGNKTERLFGYFTWHADDSPPVNPLGDLFKTEVWALARHIGVPDEIVTKPATADLIHGQTDEGDLGISYQKADHILYWLLRGLSPQEVIERGFAADEVELVHQRLESTHWKRRLPTVAMVSQTAIGEYYLRPVDY